MWLSVAVLMSMAMLEMTGSDVRVVDARVGGVGVADLAFGCWRCRCRCR